MKENNDVTKTNKRNKSSSGMENPNENSRGLERSTSRDEIKRMRLEDDKTNLQISNGNSGSTTSGAEENSRINKYSRGMENPSEDSRGLERSTSRDKNKRMSLETNETNEINPQKVPRGK